MFLKIVCILVPLPPDFTGLEHGSTKNSLTVNLQDNPGTVIVSSGGITKYKLSKISIGDVEEPAITASDTLPAQAMVVNSPALAPATLFKLEMTTLFESSDGCSGDFVVESVTTTQLVLCTG